jgi:hypothetical protein
MNHFSRKRRLLAYLDAHPEMVPHLSERDQARVQAMRDSEFTCILLVIVLEPRGEQWDAWCRTWVDPVQTASPPDYRRPPPTAHRAHHAPAPAERERADLA